MTNQVSLNVVLGSDSVTADSLANDSVTADSLASDSVTADSLANGSVAADSLADGAVITDKIANDSVTADKIADGSVAADSLADGAVTTDKIANETVTRDKIAPDVLQAAGVLPAGTILDFAGTTPPPGYLACDGSAVNRTTYAALFSAIGETWGGGDGSTTFNVPDLRRRTTIGSGGTGTDIIGNAPGNTGGAETHTLTVSETPLHGHGSGTLETAAAGGHHHDYEHFPRDPFRGYSLGGYNGPRHNTDETSETAEAGSHKHTVSGSTADAGGGQPHNNMPPSAVVNKIIKT